MHPGRPGARGHGDGRAVRILELVYRRLIAPPLPTRCGPGRSALRKSLPCFQLISLAAILVGAWGAETPPVSPSTNPLVIPFEFRRGHVMIPVRVNETNSKPFMLDTGYGMTMLEPGLAEALQLQRRGQITIVGIAGEAPAAVYEGPRLDLGGVAWTPRRVAAFPSEPGGRRRTGILGSGFFRRFVVEIDQRTKRVTLHEPASFQYSGSGEILPLRFRRDTPIVSASLAAAGGKAITGEFELDTGCDSCLCLARAFTDQHGLAPAEGEGRGGGRSGVGGGAGSRVGRLESLHFGRLRIERPEANFFQQGSPAGEGLAGHIGIEALRNFRAIIDYSRSRLILESKP
jgi:predicted aspartyl protease